MGALEQDWDSYKVWRALRLLPQQHYSADHVTASNDVAEQCADRPLWLFQATSVRGWTMPSLQDVQAKSEALALSGFTVVSSPKIRASSRSKLQVQPQNVLVVLNPPRRLSV